jgi:hypothetical protein
MSSFAPTLAPFSPLQRKIWFGFCLAVLGAVAFWAQHVVADLPTEEQRALVPVSTVWGMHACLALGLASLGGIGLAVGRWLGRRHLLIAGGFVVLGYLVCWLAPETNRILYDEHIYMQIGQTIAHTGRAEYATYAKAEYGEFTTIAAWVNKQPNGHPYLLSWAYRLAGVSESVSHVVERLAVGFTAALLYLALVIVPVALPAGAVAAVPLCFLLTPLVLWWGQTVAVEPTAVLTTVAGFFAACLHARCRNLETGEGAPLTALLLAVTAAFAAYFRPESLLVFPVIATLLWAVDRRLLEDRVTWAAFGVSLALLAPHLLHLWSVRTEDWGATDGRRFDTGFLQTNLASNAGYFVQQKWFPLAGSVLALCGAGWLALRQRWFGVCAGTWFLLSWGIFVLFYAGGYYYGASTRYAVVSSVAVALFMGIGATALWGGLRRQPLLRGLAGAVVALNWIAAMHFVPTLGRETNQGRADLEFIREAAAQLPTGSLIVSADPCVWAVLGRNSSQLMHVEGMIRTDLHELVNQYPGGIYLHWDYWVNAQQNFVDVWRDLVLRSQATLIMRRNAEEAKMAIFRLDTPHALATMGKPLPLERQNKHLAVNLDTVLAELSAAEAHPGPDPAPDTPPAPPPAPAASP